MRRDDTASVERAFCEVPRADGVVVDVLGDLAKLNDQSGAVTLHGEIE